MVRTIKTGGSKVLVLDLDDTLWGGTLAENGISGLAAVDSTTADGWFNTLSASEADQSRTKQYQQNVKRKELFETSISYEDYLLSLGTKITMLPIKEKDIARISQLSMRTNQFNATTLRFTNEAVLNYCQSTDKEIVAIFCQDNFGDHGLVAALFLHHLYDSSITVIDNFIMSCRVIGRGVEHGIFDSLVTLNREMKTERIAVLYRRSKKNSKVLSFYQSFGFEPMPLSADIFDHSLYDIASDDLQTLQLFIHSHSHSAESNYLEIIYEHMKEELC